MREAGVDTRPLLLYGGGMNRTPRFKVGRKVVYMGATDQIGYIENVVFNTIRNQHMYTVSLDDGLVTVREHMIRYADNILNMPSLSQLTLLYPGSLIETYDDYIDDNNRPFMTLVVMRRTVAEVNMPRTGAAVTLFDRIKAGNYTFFVNVMDYNEAYSVRDVAKLEREWIVLHEA